MKTNQLKAGVVLTYSSMILGYIISIGYTPIMLRLLGQSEYGLYTLVFSVVSYLGILNFGFGSAYMRYYSRYKVKNEQNNISKLNGMFIIVFSVIGIIALIAGIGLIFNTGLIFGDKLTANELAKAKILMAIMIFNIAISFPLSVFDSHITANEKFIFQNVLQMVRTVASPMIMLPVLLLGYKSVGMIVVTTILSIFIGLTNVIFCFKKLKITFSFRNFDFALMKEMTIFSSYIFINIITDQINWNIDKFLVGRFVGTAAVAVYGIGAQLNGYYMSLSGAISTVFVPRVNRMVVTSNDNEAFTKLFTKIGRIQFIVLSLICTCLIFFGKPFITLWAGPNYSDAYPIALLLIIPVSIPAIQNIGLAIQKAKNMHKFRSLVYFFIAIGNLCVSIPLAKLYGGVGAAAGTAFALLLGNGLAMNLYYHKTVGLDIKYFWYQIFKFTPSLILPVITGIALNRLFDLYHVIPFLLSIIIYSVIFCISMWILGMNRYEKELIVKPILKRLKNRNK